MPTMDNCTAVDDEARLEVEIELNVGSVRIEREFDLSGPPLNLRKLRLPLPTSPDLASLAATFGGTTLQTLLSQLSPLSLPGDVIAIPGLLTASVPDSSLSSGLVSGNLWPEEPPMVPMLSAGLCLSLVGPNPFCFNVNATMALPIGTLLRFFNLPGDADSASDLLQSSAFERLKTEALGILPQLMGGVGASFEDRINSLINPLFEKLSNPFMLLQFAYQMLDRGRVALEALGSSITNTLGGLTRACEEVAQSIMDKMRGVG